MIRKETRCNQKCFDMVTTTKTFTKGILCQNSINKYLNSSIFLNEFIDLITKNISMLSDLIMELKSLNMLDHKNNTKRVYIIVDNDTKKRLEALSKNFTLREILIPLYFYHFKKLDSGVITQENDNTILVKKLDQVSL